MYRSEKSAKRPTPSILSDLHDGKRGNESRNTRRTMGSNIDHLIKMQVLLTRDSSYTPPRHIPMEPNVRKRKADNRTSDDEESDEQTRYENGEEEGESGECDSDTSHDIDKDEHGDNMSAVMDEVSSDETPSDSQKNGNIPNMQPIRPRHFFDNQRCQTHQPQSTHSQPSHIGHDNNNTSPSGAYKTSEGGVGVEVYPDADTRLDPEMVNLIVGKIAAARTTYVPCVLPEDERDLEEIEEMKRKAEEDGEVDDGFCPMCSVGDEGLTKASSEVLQNLSHMESELYGRVSDSMLRNMKVDVYNKYVYDAAIKVGRKNVIRWTVYKMYLHEKRCNKRNFERDIMENVKTIKRHKKFLEENVIFTKASVGGCVSDKISYDYKASHHWLQLCREEINHMTALKKIEAVGSKSDGSGTQNLEKKKANSYGALKEQSDGIYFSNK